MPKTSPTTPRTLAPELATLAQRFETWRAARQRGERIPADLWQAATEHARIHGLNPTAAALKLSYDNLQRRLLAGAAPQRGGRTAPTFVELPPVAFTPGGCERGTVELVHTSGARLILRLPDAGPRDLLPVVQLFLRRRA